MGKSYSMDLRIRVIDDVNQGLSPEAASQKYSVSRRVIFKWKRRLEETGSLEPSKGRTGPKFKLEPYRKQILAAVESNSSITLEQLKCELNLPGCLQTLWNALRRWGIVLKKSDTRRRTATT